MIGRNKTLRGNSLYVSAWGPHLDVTADLCMAKAGVYSESFIGEYRCINYILGGMKLPTS